VLVLADAIDGGVGQERHESAGKPLIPSVLVDGVPMPVIHPTQLRSILGMAGEATDEAEPWLPMGWDIAAILDDWVRLIEHCSWEQLLAPTLSRGRTPRNLTVNVCRPIEMLPRVYREHFFAWYTGEADLQVEAWLRSREAVVEYARAASVAWQSFLLELSELSAVDDPSLTTTRGDSTFSDLLRAQRFHAAFHHRQVVHFLQNEEIAVPQLLDVTAFAGIGLPASLY
jgi:hypothetical protein